MGGIFQQIAEGTGLLSGQQMTTSQPENPILGALQSVSQTVNTLNGKGDEVIAAQQKQQKQQNNKAIAHGLVDEIQKFGTLPQNQIDILRKEANSGETDNVRASYNFLVDKAKKTKDEAEKKALIDSANKYGDVMLQDFGTPQARDFFKSLVSTNPQAAATFAASYASKSKNEVKDNLKATKAALLDEQRTIAKPAPEVADFQSIIDKVSAKNPTNADFDLNAENLASRFELTAGQAKALKDALDRTQSTANKAGVSLTEPTIFQKALTGIGATNPKKVLNPQDALTAIMTEQVTPEKLQAEQARQQRLKEIQGQVQHLDEAQGNIQAFSPKTGGISQKVKGGTVTKFAPEPIPQSTRPAPPPLSETVRIQTSKGQLLDIPRKSLDEAKKRDKGLKVLNGTR